MKKWARLNIGESIVAKSEPVFTFKTGHDLPLDQLKWYIHHHDSSYGGYPYKMETTIPLPVQMLKAIKKEDPKALVAQQLYFYFRSHGIELDPPSMGQIGRAKGNFKPLSVTYYLKSPFIAYALGGNLGYGKGGYLNIDAYKSRLEEAHHIYDKAVKFREDARKAIDKEMTNQGYRDADSREEGSKDMWEQNYKKNWIKLMDEMDAKGLSWVDLHHKGKN